MATCAQSGMAPHYWSASTEDKGEQRLSLSLPATYNGPHTMELSGNYNTLGTCIDTLELCVQVPTSCIELRGKYVVVQG